MTVESKVFIPEAEAEMATTKIEHPSVDERKARGKESRERMPHADHAGWEPARGPS